MFPKVISILNSTVIVMFALKKKFLCTKMTAKSSTALHKMSKFSQKVRKLLQNETKKVTI